MEITNEHVSKPRNSIILRNDRCYEENSNDDMKVVTGVVVHLFRLDGWTSGRTCSWTDKRKPV